MKITRLKQDTGIQRWAGWHILTVAEDGFSMLDIYGRQRGVDRNVIRSFADSINERDEPGSLHPQFTISALPRRYFREQSSSIDPTVIADFKRHIVEFIEANRSAMLATRILVDFHVSPQHVPARYLEAAEKVFRANGQGGPIDEVVIFN